LFVPFAGASGTALFERCCRVSYSLLAILLLVVGLVLLVAEVFIPSGGVILVLALASIAGSLGCGWLAWMPGRPLAFWSLVGALGILGPATLITAFRFWPETAIGKRALLEGPAPEDVIPFERQASRHESLVGRVGRTVTVLNPAGMAVIDGSRVHCQSEGMIIAEGTPVRVVAARHNNVTVREHMAAVETTSLPSAASAAAEQAIEEPGTAGGAGPDLDFPLG
jgi:membrane-bound ClpP family serine protease